MNRIITAFPVPILEAELDNHEEINAKLRMVIEIFFDLIEKKTILGYEWNKQLLTKERDKRGYSSFNSGTLTEKNEFDFFFQSISTLITEFFSQLDFRGTWAFANAWSSVYPKGSWVPSHCHPGAHWSGVYYVSASDGCGDLLLSDPKEYASVNDPAGFRWRGDHQMSVTPADGKLCVFPGYLKHQTQPNRSDYDRIIISFNIQAIPSVGPARES
jgi:uncharacterized protein (TIGR02466 family)